MHASLFEIWKLTQRVREGAGAPDGHDREAAFATTWLCERGFPAFDMLGKLKPETASWWIKPDDAATPFVLNAHKNPLVSLGVDVIDLAEALAERANAQGRDEGSVLVLNARAVLFALPFAARRAANAGVFRLRWVCDGTAYQATVAGAEKVWIDGPDDSAAGLLDVGQVCDLEVTYDVDGAALRAGDGVPPGNLMDPQRLAERRMQTLACGVEVDDALWAHMNAAARKVLVPESEQSRALGAGGGDAND